MYYCFQILQQKKQVHVLLLPDPPAEKAGTRTIASRSSSRKAGICTIASRSSSRKSRYMYYCFQTAVVAVLHAALDFTI